MVRVSWLLAVVFALALSAPGLSYGQTGPEKITDPPPKTLTQRKAEMEAQERAEEEAAWKAFEEAEAKYKEVRARNADKIEAYDDAIEAWRKANPPPAGTTESMISQSVDYETALYESTRITYYNRFNVPTHIVEFGPDAKPTGPVTQTQQGKAWETIGPKIVKGGYIGLSYGRDFDGNEIITRAQLADEHGYRTGEMQFNFDGIAWRTEYWGEDGKRNGGQEDLSLQPPKPTMGGPLDMPKPWRVITQPCEECRAKTERYNDLAQKANALISLMADQSKMHERAWPEAQKPIKLRFNHLKRQLDELTPQLEAAQAEALACHRICRPPAEPQQDAVLTSPPAGKPKLPAPDLTRPALTPIADLNPPASFCDEFARVAYMNEVYTPAAKASLANARVATEHLGKLGGMFTDYMKNEGGPGWAAVRAEQTAYGPLAEDATKQSNAINAMYQQILAIPIVPCPGEQQRVATGGDPVPPPAAPMADAAAVIPARLPDGKKPCPPKQKRQPIVVGPNSKVGSGAKLAKDITNKAMGMLGGALGLGGGGGGGGGGPTLYKCTLKDSKMTLFKHPSGLALRVGAQRGKGDSVLITAEIDKSPDKGTFQAALLEKPGTQQLQPPSEVGPCDLWGEWQLTVSWTKTTYVDGKEVYRESGGWAESGKFSLPGQLSKVDNQGALWKRMGFSSASHGAKKAIMAFKVPPGGGPLTFVTWITQPKGDPVTAVPIAVTMTETAPGVFTFTEGEAEPDCPEPLVTSVATVQPPPAGSGPVVATPTGTRLPSMPPSDPYIGMTPDQIWTELPFDLATLRSAIDAGDADPCQFGYETATRKLAELRANIARVRAGGGLSDLRRQDLDEMSKRLDQIEAELAAKKAAPTEKPCPATTQTATADIPDSVLDEIDQRNPAFLPGDPVSSESILDDLEDEGTRSDPTFGSRPADPVPPKGPTVPVPQGGVMTTTGTPPGPPVGHLPYTRGLSLSAEDIVDGWVADDLKLIDRINDAANCDPALTEQLREQLRRRLNAPPSGDFARDEALEHDRGRMEQLLDWLSGDPKACRPPGAPPKQPAFDPAPADYTPPAGETDGDPEGGQTQERPKEAPLPPPDTRTTPPTPPPQGPPKTYEPTTRAPGERWAPAMPEKYRSLKGSKVGDLRKLQDLFDLLHKGDGDRAKRLEEAANTCRAGGYIDTEQSWWSQRDRWRDSLMLTLGLIDTAQVEGPQSEQIRALLDAERFSVKEMLDTVDALQEPTCPRPTLPPEVDAPPESILDSIEEVFVPA